MVKSPLITVIISIEVTIYIYLSHDIQWYPSSVLRLNHHIFVVPKWFGTPGTLPKSPRYQPEIPAILCQCSGSYAMRSGTTWSLGQKRQPEILDGDGNSWLRWYQNLEMLRCCNYIILYNWLYIIGDSYLIMGYSIIFTSQIMIKWEEISHSLFSGSYRLSFFTRICWSTTVNIQHHVTMFDMVLDAERYIL